jgi:hypothetical protein
VALRRPQLQLRVAGGAQTNGQRAPLFANVDRGDRLRVAAVEPLGQTYERGEHLHRPPQRAGQPGVVVVRLLGRAASMVPRHEPDHFDLRGIEPSKISILDQIVRVAVMALVADVHADVVQQRAVFEPLPLAVGEPVQVPRLIEE